MDAYIPIGNITGSGIRSIARNALSGSRRAVEIRWDPVFCPDLIMRDRLMKKKADLLEVPKINKAIELIMETAQLNGMDESLLITAMSAITVAMFHKYGSAEQFAQYVDRLKSMWRDYDKDDE